MNFSSEINIITNCADIYWVSFPVYKIINVIYMNKYILHQTIITILKKFYDIYDVKICCDVKMLLRLILIHF